VSAPAVLADPRSTEADAEAGLRSSRIAVAVSAILFLLVTIATVPADLAVFRAGASISELGWTTNLAGAALIATGLLLLWRLPWHPVAVLLTGFGLFWGVDGLAAAWANYAAEIDPNVPLGTLAYWFVERMGAGLLLFLPLLLVLFPDGRLLGGAWRWVSIVSIALVSLILIGGLLADFDAVYIEQAADPARQRLDQPWFVLALPDEAWPVFYLVTQVSPVLGTVLALIVAIVRYVKSDAVGRSQLRWLLWSGAVVALLLMFSRSLPDEWVIWLFFVAFSLISVSVMVAVLRYKLYSIDRLLSWTLVYGALLAGVLLVDVVLVAIVGSAIDERTTALFAVLVVTLLYAPLRERLFRIASRVVNGRRDDPYGVVSALAGRLEEASDAAEQLEEVAKAIADAFASPYVRVELDQPAGGTLAASAGIPHGETSSLPLEYRGVPIGRVGMEPGRRPRLSPRDQRLLVDLVRQAAAAIRASELNAELQHIRERLVAAREDEKHRLRRDLHDGLGPLLASIRLRVETARNLAAVSPEKSREFIDSAIADTTEAVTDISRLVSDLRPPALDELGLVRALEQQCERFRSADRTVRFEADVAGPLTAAVEVAAYRIVSEALNNVARHSGADEVEVRLSLSDALTLDVRDNGRGIPEDAVAGIGLSSQRERAVELGGTWEVTARPGGGTIVRAVLPVLREKELANA
jgi:signal transduction histidine kinase